MLCDNAVVVTGIYTFTRDEKWTTDTVSIALRPD